MSFYAQFTYFDNWFKKYYRFNETISDPKYL